MDPKITIHPDTGETLAHGLTLAHHYDSLADYLRLLDDLKNRRTTPSKVIGKGYGSNARSVAMEWIKSGIVEAQQCIVALEKLAKASAADPLDNQIQIC
jgi:hypothetical protein